MNFVKATTLRQALLPVALILATASPFIHAREAAPKPANSFVHLSDWIPRLPATSKFALRSHSDFKNRDLKATVLSTTEADQVFNEISGLPYIPYRYLRDGCYARAHAISLELEKRGIISVKIFLKGRLKFRTSLSPTGYVQWWYHVAPAILVRDAGGQTNVRIFDPTLAPSLIALTSWLDLQTTVEHPNYYFENRFAYNPDEHDISDWDPLDLEDTEDMLMEHMQQQTQSP